MWLLHGNSQLWQITEHVKDSEGVVKLLEDLHEAIYHYQVCSYPDALDNIDKYSRLHNKQQPTTRGADRW